MNRRKLLAEKIVDGECKVFGGLVEKNFPGTKKFLSGLAANPSVQRFLVLEENTLASGRLITEENAESLGGAFKAPFDAFWVEEITGLGERIAHIGMAVPADALEDISLSAGGELILGRPPECAGSDPKVIVTWHVLESGGVAAILPFGLVLNEGDLMKTAVRFWVDDLQGAGQYVSALASECSWTLRVLFSMLNIKNAASMERFDPPEDLNKARKKRGKQPLYSYTYVRILAGAERYYEESDNEKVRAVRAAHVRRGHFKHCKTGVFWWKPHSVGVGEVKHRDAYVITT